MPDKENPTLIEGCLQVGSVGRATHTEIGKVVQILPEKVLAIAFVRPSVQDVGMPEIIDRPRWTDLLVSICDIESEKTTIQILDFALVLRRPSLLFTKLPFEHAEI